MTHKFKLNLTAAGNRSTLEMDGQPLHGVKSIRVQCAVDRATRVLVEFVAYDVEIEAEAELGARKNGVVMIGEYPADDIPFHGGPK